jgi:hypothetical protein
MLCTACDPTDMASANIETSQLAVLSSLSFLQQAELQAFYCASNTDEDPAQGKAYSQLGYDAFILPSWRFYVLQHISPR